MGAGFLWLICEAKQHPDKKKVILVNGDGA
jgi:hypothetical protein